MQGRQGLVATIGSVEQGGTAQGGTGRRGTERGGTERGWSLAQRAALAVVPRLTALTTAAIGMTLRFELIAEDDFVQPEAGSPEAKGIYCFWHQCTLAAGWYFRKYGATILISRSFDGELIARTLELLGYKSVRGSSSRGGVAGLIALRDVVQRGLIAIFTADGPRGPIYQTKMGPVKLAAMTGEPMGSFYLLPERAWVFGSWDRFMVPKPFSRVVVSWARRVAAPAADADAETMEAKRVELNEALERARLRAEEHLAGRLGSGSARAGAGMAR